MNPIEIRYRISEKGQFDEAMTKALEDWNERGSLKHFWTKEQPWRNLPDGQVETILGERIIKVAPKQAVKIEQGHYNPITEEFGELTDIVEIKIVSTNGEITLKGKSLLGQFEKAGYTFTKTYKDDIKKRN
jgi:hypothetical protein